MGLKKIVKNVQRHIAMLDFALNMPPRKTSKTYLNAYAECYAEAECMDSKSAYSIAYAEVHCISAEDSASICYPEF
jgi:hypothetical protein